MVAAAKETFWEKLQATIVAGFLSFAGFFMWNAGQTLVIHDVKIQGLEQRVDKLEG